jgi:hypothetical protein
MTVYTFSEARQKFASLLERARREGGVQVRRRDGQVFLIQPQRPRSSPLDVAGIDSDLSMEEVVAIVRDMRLRASVPRLKRTSDQRARKRAAKTR